jgi:hypothetical protein
MIPRLAKVPAPGPLQVAFLAELRARGFEGQLSLAHADRTVLATDNSIYQVFPQAIAFPAGTEDLVRIATIAAEPRFHALKRPGLLHLRQDQPPCAVAHHRAARRHGLDLPPARRRRTRGRGGPADRVGVIHRLVDTIHRDNETLIAARFPKLNRSLTGYDLAHIRDRGGASTSTPSCAGRKARSASSPKPNSLPAASPWTARSRRINPIPTPAATSE